MNRNFGMILIIGVIALLAYNMSKTTSSTTAVVTDNTFNSSLSTDQKRRQINMWWETATSPTAQDADGGRFEDIINSISPGEIDTIYQYVYGYVMLGNRPQPGSALYNAMQTIITNYQIFQ